MARGRGGGVSVKRELRMTVNDGTVEAEVSPRLLLLDFLREELGLTGTHAGCEQGACGACTVLLDGEPVRSCLMFAVQARGRTVETIEGLTESDPLTQRLQESFSERHALQCGFCTPGFIVTSRWLLTERRGELSRDDIRAALGGNVCRCTGYVNIVSAIQDVSAGNDA
jgi:carbon-monoxide dehydrogenase small subunit